MVLLRLLPGLMLHAVCMRVLVRVRMLLLRLVLCCLSVAALSIPA
jgi:hypothetical protein